MVKNFPTFLCRFNLRTTSYFELNCEVIFISWSTSPTSIQDEIKKKEGKNYRPKTVERRLLRW